jgi:hypothetical protein
MTANSQEPRRIMNMFLWRFSLFWYIFIFMYEEVYILFTSAF